MENTRKTAGKGLYYIFIGQIISLFTVIPLLGIFAALAGSIMTLYGFYTISKATAEYQTAFILTIANLAASMAGNVIGGGILTELLKIIGSLLSFAVIYFVCTSTANLLQGIDPNLVNRAGLIWKLCGICTMIMVICGLLIFIPIINLIAGLVTILTAFVQLAASILYLIFLWGSQKALKL